MERIFVPHPKIIQLESFLGSPILKSQIKTMETAYYNMQMEAMS